MKVLIKPSIEINIDGDLCELSCRYISSYCRNCTLFDKAFTTWTSEGAYNPFRCKECLLVTTKLEEETKP